MCIVRVLFPLPPPDSNPYSLRPLTPRLRINSEDLAEQPLFVDVDDDGPLARSMRHGRRLPDDFDALVANSTSDVSAL